MSGPGVAGAISDGALDELSGLAVSRKQRDLIWAHNDSGGQASLYAVAPTGEVLAEVELTGAENVDWEDIAIGPLDEERDYIYVADTGDNRSERPSVTLYRVVEPPKADLAGVGEVGSLRIAYEGGPVDVEALLVDPDSGDAYLFGKSALGDAPLFVVPASVWDREMYEAARVGVLDLAVAELITAADISPDGRTITVRTYTRVILWDRAPGETIAAAMTGAPCDLTPPAEAQGEAVTIAADRIFTVGEGVGAPIHVYRFPG